MSSENSNYVISLQPQTLEKEFKCFKCQAFPISPLECRTCDAIKCSDCVKTNEYSCRPNCSQPHYAELRPKTRLLFESVMIKCRRCPQKYNALNIAQHEEQCAENSYDRDDQLILSNTQGSENVPAIVLYKPAYRLGGVIIGLVSLIVMLHTLYYAINMIFMKENLTFHLVCAGQFAGSEGICLFASGQFAVGIIVVAQFGVGIITISQIGIGLLFGIAQITSGVGVSIGQVVSAFYAFRAQIGIAFFAIGKAQIGFQSLYSLIHRKSPFVMNCKSRKTRVARS